MANEYDLIVVGAGPGGATAAKTAAEKGLRTLMIERGRTPGDKNMSGATFFRKSVEKTFPEFSKQKFITQMPVFSGLSLFWTVDNDEKGYGMRADTGREPFRDMLNLYRPEADGYCAAEAVKAGAKLLTGTVQDVIIENGAVKGVVVDEGKKIYAPVTIAADGLHSTVAKKAGLAEFGAERVAVAIKYVYELDPEILLKRSGSTIDPETGQEVFPWGAHPMYIGDDPTFYLTHLVFWPRRGQVIATVYDNLEDEIRNRSNIHQRMKWFLDCWEVKQALQGAKFIYFDVHCLTYGNDNPYNAKTYMPGLMVIGDAAGWDNPTDGWGANPAQTGGRIAADVAAEAKRKGDYSEAVLSRFEKEWRETYIGEDEGTPAKIGAWFKKRNAGKLVKALDNFASGAVADKFNDYSYDQIFARNVLSLLPAATTLAEAAPIFKGVIEKGVKTAGQMSGMLSMLQGKE